MIIEIMDWILLGLLQQKSEIIKRDFSVFDRKILVYYMLYSTYSLAAFYQSNVIGVIIKTA